MYIKPQKSNSSPWIQQKDSINNGRLRLFCFPYAGAGASFYYPWQAKLPGGVELCPIQLPGRENRVRDPLYTQLRPIVKDMADSLQSYLDKPFAFFGYSMGAKIAFELALELRKRNCRQPELFIASACRAAHIPETVFLHKLADRDFIEAICKSAPGSETILKDKEMAAFFVPMLRADFSVSETYQYKKSMPLNYPIVAFAGHDDKEEREQDIKVWSEHTSADFTFEIFEGDHFFIKSSNEKVVRSVSKHLSDRL